MTFDPGEAERQARRAAGRHLLAILVVGGSVWMVFLFAVAFINSWVGG